MGWDWDLCVGLLYEHRFAMLIILHCHEIFAQVCESARINFESYRRAVKAACKCRTKDCPAWACLCYDVEGEEEQDDICHCGGCDCDVCSSCKVKSLE